jgi:DNA polymerase-3 subunit gamma/tau
VSLPGGRVVCVDAPLALYRRYRPDTFAEVIGQDHVAEPLSHALDGNRVNHAYLFSGPRGCGKTTCARIMARALNCEKGPTSTPCGVCESCVELARGGPGSIDVIEIDAASHGGVDDARDLRERAMFAPVRSRYKVYIIDEAHMVTTQGFNALLKLVEEPPSHLRFIFATTEPDKVIGTIRSRTHHYPFRLVPPKILGDYLVDLCGRERVPIEPTVVPLVVRAGAGSVRDSLSVLDQLMGGSGADGISYELATSLLGYTPSNLLDETVDALAAHDGGTLFGVIEKVVDTGQDPRRFAEDLLHRLRDLVIVSAVPDAGSRGLIELADDQADRLSGQAGRFGRAALTRAADIVSVGLTEMRGATAPRLLLEIMLARILLPAVDDTAEGLGARIDRLERRLSVPSQETSAAAAPSVAPPASPAPPAVEAEPVPATPVEAPETRTATAETAVEPAAAAEPAPAISAETPAPPVAAAAVDEPVAPPLETSTGRLGLIDVRQLWPGVLDRVKATRRYAWVLLSQNAQVKAVEGDLLTIGMVNAGARDSFTRSGADEILQQALIDELGVDWRVEAIVDPDAAPAARAGGRDRSSRPASDQPAPPAAAPSTQPATDSSADWSTDSSDVAAPADDIAPPAWARGADDDSPAGLDVSAPSSAPAESSSELPSESPTGDDPQSRRSRAAEAEAAKAAVRPMQSGGKPAEGRVDEAEVSDDDSVIDDSSVSDQELLARELGAEVIEDIRHEAG